MKKSMPILSALIVLALAALACGGGGQPPAAATPPLNPTPTPPPIPSRPPEAATLVAGLTPTVPPTIQAGQLGVIVYGSLRDGDYRLYLLSLDGHSVTPVDLGPDLHAVWPDVSPDGTRIAFASVSNNVTRRPNGIFVAGLDGSDPVQITFGEGEHPKWSPDGTRIAFTCGDGADICVINADGSGRKNLTENSPWVERAPDWTPEGRIVFMSDRDLFEARYSEIYMMNADGTGIVRLTNDNAAYNANPSVSPDGTRIAFESDRDIEIGSDIYVIDITGRNLMRVTDDGVWNQNPVWSPDGTNILYTADPGNGNMDLYAVSPAGGSPAQMTHHPAEDGGLRLGHTWLPTPVQLEVYEREDDFDLVRPPLGSSRVSNAILFAANNFNCSDCLETGIYWVAFDGANLTRLPLEGAFPAWDPNFQRIAYTHNGELFIANTDGSAPTQITHAMLGLSSVQWDEGGDRIVADCVPYNQHDVCIIDLARGIIQNITQEFTFDTGVPYPHWYGENITVGTQVLAPNGKVINVLPFEGRVSPDGTLLAGIVDRQVVVANVDGSDPKTITGGTNSTKGFPTWSPAGDLVVYSSAPGDGRLYLEIVRYDGSNPMRLIQQPIALGPVEVPPMLTTFYGFNWAP